MFSWCFKRQTTDDDEYHQRPKTRNTSANSSQKTSRTAVSITTREDENKEPDKKSVEQMQNECLEAHNRYRAKHGASPLTLSKKLNSYATEWAKQLAKSNTLQHRKNNKYGENLYLGTNMGPKTQELAVTAWYDEIHNYNFNKPGFSPSTGHFTQVVWKTSKVLGVGIVTEGNRTWVVCNYDPPGNIMGNYMNCVSPLVEETVSKIIDKMKPQKKKFCKETPKSEATKPDAVTSTYSASDLKLWSKYELECLASHNQYRAIHGSPAMKLNRKLCSLAQDWTKHLAKKKAMQHRPNNEHGENIYYAFNFDPSAEHCVKSWYDEIKNYNFSKPGFSSQTGHFTQVVWKDSIELGVGITKINNMTFVVCNYSPAGNVMNQYKDQVPRPGAKPSTTTTNNSSASSSSRNNSDKQQPFEEVCLESHNNLRALHGSPAMTLNKNLNFFANDWAQHLASKNKLELRKNNRFGENIYYTTDPDVQGQHPVEFWYKNIQYYNFNRPGYSEATASFTQVIWRSSRELGVGVAKVGRFTYVVCTYDPKGNIQDKFAENVPLVGGECILKLNKHQLPENIDEFTANILKAHNIYRAKHRCPALKLSQELMDYCEKYANLLRDNKPFTDIPKYAVSITKFQNGLPSADEIVSQWYKEIERYDFQKPKYDKDTRHFTQIVWKNTKFMGVGVSKSNENSIVVLSYEPSGNIDNQYAENVPPVI